MSTSTRKVRKAAATPFRHKTVEDREAAGARRTTYVARSSDETKRTSQAVPLSIWRALAARVWGDR